MGQTPEVALGEVDPLPNWLTDWDQFRDNLQVNAMLRRYLHSLKLEVEELLTQYYPTLGDLSTRVTCKQDIIALIDYYVEPMYEQARTLLSTYTFAELKVDERLITDIRLYQLPKVEVRLLAMLSDPTLTLETLQVITLGLLLGTMLTWYREMQLALYSGAGMTTLRVEVGEEACHMCRRRHDHVYNLGVVKTWHLTHHAFCTLTLLPTTDLKVRDHQLANITLIGLPVVWERNVIKPLRILSLEKSSPLMVYFEATRKAPLYQDQTLYLGYELNPLPTIQATLSNIIQEP